MNLTGSELSTLRLTPALVLPGTVLNGPDLAAWAGLRETVRDRPDDWGTWGVMADWLDDHNRPREAHALRWCAGRRLRPWWRTRYPATPATPAGRRVPAPYAWAWVRPHVSPACWYDRQGIPGHCVLPAAVFYQLRGHADWLLTDSWDSALWLLARGLGELRRVVGLGEVAGA